MLQNLEDLIPADERGITQYEKRRIEELLGELAKRSIEGLNLYEPLPYQESYHACTAKECIIQKGNQTGGEQPYTEPVLTPDGWRTIGELKVGDQVIGGDGKPCSVVGITEFGRSPTYRFTFSDGTTTEAGINHNWTCRLGGRARRPKTSHVDESNWNVVTTEDIKEYVGKWGIRFTGEGRNGAGRYRVVMPSVQSVEFPEKPVPIDPYTLGVLIGDGNYTHDSVSLVSEDEEIVSACVPPDGVEIVLRENTSKHPKYGKASLYGFRKTCKGKYSPLMQSIKSLGMHGKSGHQKGIPSLYLRNSVEVRKGLLRGLMDTDGFATTSGGAMFYTSSKKLVQDFTELVRSLGGKVSADWRTNSHKGSKGRELAHLSISGISFCPFRLSRKADRYNTIREGKRVNFKFLSNLEFIGYKQSRCIQVDNKSHTYVTRDYIVTHNSLAGFVEVARAVTGQDPYNKYPKENGCAVCLGYGEKHIGRVIYKYLFQVGAFNIIRDQETNEWRTFRPWSPDREWQGKKGDKGREAEIQPAPPLVPERFIKGKIAFEKKSEFIFSRVEFVNGWVLYALNSAGDPSQAQGFQANLYHIDEDVATSGWHEEAIGRTMTREGLIRWTALPHQKTNEILEMIQRAEEQEKDENPRTVCLRATMYDNPYIPEESIKENERIWKSAGEDIYRKRALGELTLDKVNVYPGFSKWTHNAIRMVTDSERMEEASGVTIRNPAQKILSDNGGIPPEDWCKYMIVDPGHAVCAVGYFCVPPPEVGHYKILYDEDYLTGATAKTFGAAVEKKIRNTYFEDFIIDAHGGRLTSLESGIQPRIKYQEELEERGVRCEKRGSRFLDGSDDIPGRELALREWLMIRSDGYPTFMVYVEKCPNFVREIQNFKKKTVRIAGREITTDDANRRGACHMVEVSEYGAAHGLPYVRPKRKVVSGGPVDWILKGREMRQAQREANGQGGNDKYINLGPTGVG